MTIEASSRSGRSQVIVPPRMRSWRRRRVSTKRMDSDSCPGEARPTSPPGWTRAMDRAAGPIRVVTDSGRIPGMRKPMAALALLVVALILGEGCAPVPLPHYAAYPARRVEELLVDSENLRQAGDEWERFWFLDQPSHMTPFRTHGGLGP